MHLRRQNGKKGHVGNLHECLKASQVEGRGQRMRTGLFSPSF